MADGLIGGALLDLLLSDTVLLEMEESSLGNLLPEKSREGLSSSCRLNKPPTALLMRSSIDGDDCTLLL